MKKDALYIAVLACAVLGTAAHSEGLPGAMASARLNAATGVPQPNAALPVQGTLHFSQSREGVRVEGTITGLKPNAEHAFHVHEKGDCSAPDLSSAGGHFNPTGQPHGAYDSAHHHLGDMRPLMADASGSVRVSFTSASLMLTGPNSIVGKAVIVHRDPDEVNVQPAGNAGPRLACGVIVSGA